MDIVSMGKFRSYAIAMLMQATDKIFITPIESLRVRLAKM
jgi:hypothetical protein